MATPTLPNDYSSYPVFAADQVLTSDDLNGMFDYLDEQERLSRIYLIGMGIVCGFELSVDLNKFIISVTAGSGITSFGYLLFDDAIDLAYYQPYTVPGSVPVEDQYAPFTPGSNSTFYELQSAAFVGTLSTNDQAKWTLLSTGGQELLAGKLVVLYLELSEDQMKSCLTGNCDGPGANMDMTIRYLLVNQTDLYPRNIFYRLGIQSASELPDLYLPRFNVPAGSLPDFTSIYTAYSSIFDTTVSGNIIGQLSGALQNLYAFLRPVLPAYPTSPFLQVQGTLTGILAGVQKNKPFAIQYFYDFIDDLVLAYREAQDACEAWVGKCNPDVSAFPLHLSLGLATQDTAGQQDAFRNYFIPSTLVAGETNTIEEIRSLFDRINNMINLFVIPAYTVINTGIGIFAPSRQATVAIRVTPSLSGRAPLSDRAIPYYYPIKSTDPIQDDWNHSLTLEGKSNENLSYNAGLYNVLPGGDPYVNPLNYDIVPYDFFRIEGHIGQNYSTALNSITSLINTYRLPFNVVALKLGSDSTDVTINTASFADLTSQYDVLKTSLLCALGTQVCFYGYQNYIAAGQFTFLQNAGVLLGTLKLGDINPVFKGQESVVATPVAGGTVATTLAGAVAASHAALGVTSLASTATVSFLNLAQTGLVNTDVLKFTTLLPAGLRNIFQANIYTRGQFLSSQPCFAIMAQTNQQSASIGLTYMAKVNAGSAIPANAPTEINSLSDYILALLDMIDAVVADIFYVQLGYLNLPDFTNKYNAMTSYAAQIAGLLTANLAANPTLVPAGMIDSLTRLQTSCNLGQLTALNQDYQTRYTNLQQSLLFGNFVTTNPGIDHRGGVPRGGTFLLVYYEKPPAPAATGTVLLTNQLTASLGDTAALKNIISTATTAGTFASARAASPRASVAGTGNVAASTLANTSRSSALTQLVGLIQDKQFGFSAAQQAQILGVLNQRANAAVALTDASFSLTNNSVVADFFLPYLYNPQGGPITYVYPASPAPQPNPAPTSEFVVSPTQYVSSDTNTYHFTVVPAITQADILQQTSDPTKLSNPDNLVLTATATDVTMVPQANNLAQTLTTTLQYESITQTLTIVVPLATFTVSLTRAALGVVGVSPLPGTTPVASPADMPAGTGTTKSQGKVARRAAPRMTLAPDADTSGGGAGGDTGDVPPASPEATGTTTPITGVVEPAKPIAPVTPVAGEPAKPVTPVTTTPVTPVTPITGTTPVTTTPVTGTTPAEPGKPVTPVTTTPVTPVTPITGTTPVTTTPVTGTTPAEPGKPVAPITPVTGTTPVTTTPVEPVTGTTPAEPGKPVAPVTPITGTTPVTTTPVTPVTPVTGTTPVTTPVTPVTPVTGTTPVTTPVTPVTPVTGTTPVTTPVTPVTPVTGTTPVTTPVTPVTPVTGATPVTPPPVATPVEPGKPIVPIIPVTGTTPISAVPPVTAPGQPIITPTPLPIPIDFPRMLHLSATDQGATGYAWSINQNTTVIPATATAAVDFDTLLNTLNQPATLTIALTLTYTLNGVTATNTKTTTMATTDLANAVNAGPFQPTFTS